MPAFLGCPLEIKKENRIPLPVSLDVRWMIRRDDLGVMEIVFGWQDRAPIELDARARDGFPGLPPTLSGQEKERPTSKSHDHIRAGSMDLGL
jgi:hypothetical protein